MIELSLKICPAVDYIRLMMMLIEFPCCCDEIFKPTLGEFSGSLETRWVSHFNVKAKVCKMGRCWWERNIFPLTSVKNSFPTNRTLTTPQSDYQIQKDAHLFPAGKLKIDLILLQLRCVFEFMKFGVKNFLGRFSMQLWFYNVHDDSKRISLR